MDWRSGDAKAVLRRWRETLEGQGTLLSVLADQITTYLRIRVFAYAFAYAAHAFA
jgi:hypothetical protein